MKIVVSLEELGLDKQLGRMVESTKKGAQDAAETVRDEARKNYVSMVHRTEYGQHSVIDAATSSRSLTHGIVVRPSRNRTEFEVGPKKGKINTGSKNITYEELFGYIQNGTASDKGWGFRLPWGRTGASKTGYWWTKGQDAKPFMVNTSDKVNTSQWNRMVEVTVTKRLKEEFK